MTDSAIRGELSAALDAIERCAELVSDGEVLHEIFICSGGRSEKHMENIPAIYLDPAAAVRDWRDRVCEWIEEERVARIKFLEAPKCERLLMTESDAAGAQRLTATRYGATAKIALIERKPGGGNG